MITIIDFETTGLAKAMGSDLSLQPHATEVYAQQMKEDGEMVKEFGTLIKPGAPIPDFLEKKIGITNDMVADAPSFMDIYQDLAKVFFGSHTMVAHNLTFDLKILVFSLQRIGKEYNFPYPPIHFCTMEQSMWIKGKRITNSALYEHATGEVPQNMHRAKNDVLATKEGYLWLKRQNI